jgi:hypothetical protein
MPDNGLSMTTEFKSQLSNRGQCCISRDIGHVTYCDHCSTIMSFAMACWTDRKLNNRVSQTVHILFGNWLVFNDLLAVLCLCHAHNNSIRFGLLGQLFRYNGSFWVSWCLSVWMSFHKGPSLLYLVKCQLITLQLFLSSSVLLYHNWIPWVDLTFISTNKRAPYTSVEQRLWT